MAGNLKQGNADTEKPSINLPPTKAISCMAGILMNSSNYWSVTRKSSNFHQKGAQIKLE